MDEAKPGGVRTLELSQPARAELRQALRRLRHGSGLLVRLADLMGGLLGQAGRLGLRRLGVTRAVQRKLAGLTEAALARAYDVAVLGLEGPPLLAGRPGWTRALVIASGAAGGFAGMAGFLPDATLTTLAIMREIARVAREEGEDLGDEEARLACLEVFGMQGPEAEGESELGYYSARLLFQGRPLVALISEVAARYGMVLGEKLAAQAVPLAGAAAGAALNAAFLQHYRDVARAHFTIRRLERAYGRDVVRKAAEEEANPPRDASFLEA